MSNQTIPVAEYLHMSTEDQKYSIPSQQAAIRKYAADHGFYVCQTYADPGRSGVLIKHRVGLSQLLQDVVSQKAKYRAILVYDVSRWGRFQNPDESAHYDFLCASAGIPIHYCAEQFANDGSMQSTLMKAVKRTMAGEFSRELGVKVFDATKRLILEGFHGGAVAPYGLARMLLSPSGKKKGILKRGERKNLKTDRVILVRGRKSEIECVRRIFSMCANEGKNSVEIAAELNTQGITCRRKPWTADRVLQILKRRQYLGLNVWGCRMQNLYSPSSLRPQSEWIVSKAPFKPIIDQATFDRAQQVLASFRINYSSEDLLAGLRRLLKRNQQLTCKIIDNSRSGGHSGTYQRRFGSLLKAFELAGFKAPGSSYRASEHTRQNRTLHASVLRQLQALFPNDVSIVRFKAQRAFLEVDRQISVSVLICGKRSGLVPNFGTTG